MIKISSQDARRIVNGTHDDAFSVLGLHQRGDKWTITAFVPNATSIDVLDANSNREIATLDAVGNANGLFTAIIAGRKKAFAYRLRVTLGDHVWTMDDPYRFGPVIGAVDEHLLNEGRHNHLWQVLGAHIITHEDTPGTHFALWAPNARRVSLVADCNGWDGRRNVMRKRGQSGVWEIFMPGVTEGDIYKYELLDAQGNLLPQKADPFGFGAEYAPKTASVVRDLNGHDWQDQGWMNKREVLQRFDQPISIYEVHLGSWRRVADAGNRPLSYLECADELVRYVKDMGFTHIELMPITEFPFEGSWGYQPIGLFAPTIRHGTLEEFRAFVEACHAADIGLLLDWVPGHFPEDAHGLGLFDGTHLYEHADRKEGFHPDWNTLVFNFGRREVVNYLVANALYWLREHHIDGLRVDAVASMLYRDYSRAEGEWIANIDGGRENYEAIAFLKDMNVATYGDMAGIMNVAEESTAFPAVSGRVDQGGLGFGFKWNMGWMNDTLAYMSEDPIHRKHHHHKMTFGLHYAFSENFILPISHDEVVHGKGSMINKMHGSPADKFANLRAYYGFMWGHPGKKLLFMGNEFAQDAEWNHDSSLDWHLLEQDTHRGVQSLVRDLNQLYGATPALYQQDCSAAGFEWIAESASDESVLAWVRHGTDGASPVLVVCNFTPIERRNYRIGVPKQGRWIERLNTDADHYGGGGCGNLGAVHSDMIAAHGRGQSIRLTLPPLSTLFFELDQG